MELIIEDIMLVDDPTSEGGVAFDEETLSDFIRGGATEETSLAKINKELELCGIEPITLEQIKIIGIKGE